VVGNVFKSKGNYILMNRRFVVWWLSLGVIICLVGLLLVLFFVFGEVRRGDLFEGSAWDSENRFADIFIDGKLSEGAVGFDLVFVFADGDIVYYAEKKDGLIEFRCLDFGNASGELMFIKLIPVFSDGVRGDVISEISADKIKKSDLVNEGQCERRTGVLSSGGAVGGGAGGGLAGGGLSLGGGSSTGGGSGDGDGGGEVKLPPCNPVRSCSYYYSIGQCGSGLSDGCEKKLNCMSCGDGYTCEGNVCARDKDTEVLGVTTILNLDKIVISEDALAREKKAANTLKNHLASRYKLVVEVIEKAEFSGINNSIFIGRKAAVGSGIISGGELEKVKHDGFVIKVSNDTIAISGYREIGTEFGAERFLEELGVKIYPETVIYYPIIERLDRTYIMDKESFQSRKRGKWASLNDRGSIDGRSAKVLNPEWFTPGKSGFLEHWSSSHSAPYLMPPPLFHGYYPDLYYYPDAEEYYPEYYGYNYNPDFYAMRSGKRISGGTSMSRVNLELASSEVWDITTRRALEWIALQPERRFFFIGEGDDRFSESNESRSMDVRYGPPRAAFASDRNIQWVNHVAREVAKIYPDKIIFTHAYIETVAPPFREKLEPNVVVFYCPWFRDSRNAPSRDLTHPYNMIAMKQLMDWTVKFPGQVGLFDYSLRYAPDNIQASKISYLAEHGIFGLNDDHNDPRVYVGMHDFLIASMLWDSEKDFYELRNNYLNELYGPAAKYVRNYFEAIDNHTNSFEERDSMIFSRRGPLDRPEFAKFSLEAFRQAEESVKEEFIQLEETAGPYDDFYKWTRSDKILYRVRNMERGIMEELFENYGKEKIYSQEDLVVYRDRVARYIYLHLNGVIVPRCGVEPPYIEHPTGGTIKTALPAACNNLKNILIEYAGLDESDELIQMEWVVSGKVTRLGSTYELNTVRLNPEVKTRLEDLINNPNKILANFDYAKNIPPKEKVLSRESTSTVFFDKEDGLKNWNADGFNGYVVMDKPIIPEIGDFELEIWVNLDNHSTTEHSTIFSQRGGGEDIIIYAHRGWVPMLSVFINGSYHSGMRGTDLRGRGWTKITLIRLGNKWTMYEDGVQVGTRTVESNVSQGTVTYWEVMGGRLILRAILEI
jgi:hypothetical protein